MLGRYKNNSVLKNTASHQLLSNTFYEISPSRCNWVVHDAINQSLRMRFTSQVVLKDASSRSADEARPIYEQLITFFPTSGKFWKLWIDHEVKYRYHLTEPCCDYVLQKLMLRHDCLSTQNTVSFRSNIFHSVLLQKLRASGKDIPSVPDQGVEPRAVENLPKLC